MVNCNSWGYATGKFFAKAFLLSIGYVIGKRLGRRPIDKGYPKAPPPKK